MDPKELWNNRYSEHKFAYGNQVNDFIKENIQHLMAGRILSLGEGDGRNALHLAKQSFVIHALDLSEVGLQHLQSHATALNLPITTEVADVGTYNYGNEKWDNIVSVWCHTDPETRARAHKGVVAGLKPGGVFLLEAYTPAQIQLKTGGPPTPELMMTLEDLKRELQGLVIEHGVELERDIREGQFHTGKSAVVQIRARKPG